MTFGSEGDAFGRQKAMAAMESMPILAEVLHAGVGLFRRVRAKREMHLFRRACRDLPKLVPEPVFVKVGANDGITGDPCSDILLANPQWKGLLIEPVPHCFDRLKANFCDSQRFSLEQVAIGTIAGDAPFYYVDQKAMDSIPNLPLWWDQIGSFDGNHIPKHMNGALAPFMVECTVEVCTLEDVLGRNGIGDVHLMHIDVEGHDLEILKMLDFANQAPLLIFVEHYHLPGAQKTEMVDLLRKHGYSVRDCGSDYFALHKETNDRLQRRARRAAAGPAL